VDRGRFATEVRADEKAVLTHQNEILDGLLSFVIINIEFRIFEKLSERNPVVERVIDCRQERVCWVESSLHANERRSKLFDQRFRSFAPGRQFNRRWSVSKFSLNIVEFFIYVFKTLLASIGTIGRQSK